MAKFIKSLTVTSSRHNREARIADSNTTRVKITFAPKAGEKFSPSGMDEAAKRATVAAFELAAAFMRAIPSRSPYCLPSVDSGDTWAGGASASVTFEHDGVPAVLAAIETAIEQARK